MSRNVGGVSTVTALAEVLAKVLAPLISLDQLCTKINHMLQCTTCKSISIVVRNHKINSTKAQLTPHVADVTSCLPRFTTLPQPAHLLRWAGIAVLRSWNTGGSLMTRAGGGSHLCFSHICNKITQAPLALFIEQGNTRVKQ